MTNLDAPAAVQAGHRLTERQKELYDQLLVDGFIPHRTGFGTSQMNRPLWRLVDLGFAEFGWGPKDSALQTQGFSLKGPDHD